MSQFLEIQESLLFAIREVITANGVEIAYPVHTVHLKGPAAPDGDGEQALLNLVPGRQ